MLESDCEEPHMAYILTLENTISYGQQEASEGF